MLDSKTANESEGDVLKQRPNVKGAIRPRVLDLPGGASNWMRIVDIDNSRCWFHHQQQQGSSVAVASSFPGIPNDT
ncbi:hypothetical protein CSOJ01_09116 [Colletotrichum sojae]|uniref:Uncharacterized protein n=1 Tax=Colletotrichum sojae TaxID=2175907 RepID=A0A8H6J3S9_9PEZI|nr:hypothetical protein CSOJ01_09116 [Colletotrichum sojae]